MFLYQNQLETLGALNSSIEQLTNEHTRKRKFWTASDMFDGADLPQKITELRTHAASLPPDIKIVLFMNMVTEEGLPMFTRALALGLEPKLSALSKWLELWTAEEKSHGQILDRYAFVTNLFQMTAVEKYVFEYLRIGYNPKWIYQPYATIAYALMQEAATRVSHTNVAKLARNHDQLLQKILSRIAGDEEFHYQFYLETYREIINLDPNTALEVASSMWPSIEMPGAAQANFENYARVANQLKVY
ncbi:MAG: acyl-ACP desaturase, partial [Patescibacteria group bacterium]